MAAAHTLTLGFGNGTLAGTIALVTRLGYSSSATIISGPFYVEAMGHYVPGIESADHYVAGAVSDDHFVAGAERSDWSDH